MVSRPIKDEMQTYAYIMDTFMEAQSTRSIETSSADRSNRPSAPNATLTAFTD